MNKDSNLKRALRNNEMDHRLSSRHARCDRCGEEDRAALTRMPNSIICYQCQITDRGLPPIENHHVAGRKNDPFTIPLSANDHRVTNDRQNDWPRKTLCNPNDSPLLKDAARLRGLWDLLLISSERIICPILEVLENFEKLLDVRFGSNWWRDMTKKKSNIKRQVGRSEDNPIHKHAARLRELNDRLLALAQDFVGEIPQCLEELDELMEQQFGPDCWKRIYDQIPEENKLNSPEKEETEDGNR